MKMFIQSASTALVVTCIATVGSFSLCKEAQAKVHPQATLAAHPDTYDALIAKHAKRHGVPEALVHRVIVRESRYRPTAMNRIYFGLMQITYATARSMGYKGEPKGLLDAETNLTYAVPYLANAYMVAGKNDDRAVALYAAGYYFEARRLHKLELLRTASSEPLTPPPPPVVVAQAEAPQQNPVAMLFHALTGDPAPPPAAESNASAATPANETSQVANSVPSSTSAPVTTPAADANAVPVADTKAHSKTEAKSLPVTKKKMTPKKMTAANTTNVAKTVVVANLKPATKTAALPAGSKPDAR